jgi:uncharacterized protein YukE
MGTVVSNLCEAQELVDELEAKCRGLGDTYFEDQCAMIRQALQRVQEQLGYNRGI